VVVSGGLLVMQWRSAPSPPAPGAEPTGRAAANIRPSDVPPWASTPPAATAAPALATTPAVPALAPTSEPSIAPDVPTKAPTASASAPQPSTAVNPPTPPNPQPPTPNPQPDPRVETLLAGMTLRQKVGQLLMLGFDGQTADAAAAIVNQYAPGAIV